MTKKYIRTGQPWHKVRTKRTLAQYALFLFFALYVFIPLSAWLKTETTIVLAAEPVTVMQVSATPSPLPEVDESQEEAKGEENQEIREMIKEVFGEHADKAFKLLSCENAKLNPKAINTAGNTPKGSKDVGVFQINEHWQGVNAKFLLDPELNIRIAWKIYKDSGYSFKMWSCGKKLGI